MPSVVKVIRDIGELIGAAFTPGKYPRWDGSSFQPRTPDIGELAGAGFTASKIPVWNGSAFLPGNAPAPAGVMNVPTRTIIVDAGGKGDYTTIAAGLAAAAALSPSSNNRVTVIVNPGKYKLTQALTVPAYVSLCGYGKGSMFSTGLTVIEFTGAMSGNLITLGTYSVLRDLSINGGALTSFSLTEECGIISATDGGGIEIETCSFFFNASATYPFYFLRCDTPNVVIITVTSCYVSINNTGTGECGALKTTAQVPQYSAFNFNFCYLSGKSGCKLIDLLGQGKSKVVGGYLANGIINSANSPAAVTLENVAAGSLTLSGNVSIGISNLGTIRTKNVAAATTPGSVTGKLPVYDENGTLKGYVPVYGAIS